MISLLIGDLTEKKYNSVPQLKDKKKQCGNKNSIFANLHSRVLDDLKINAKSSS